MKRRIFTAALLIVGLSMSAASMTGCFEERRGRDMDHRDDHRDDHHGGDDHRDSEHR